MGQLGCFPPVQVVQGVGVGGGEQGVQQGVLLGPADNARDGTQV